MLDRDQCVREIAHRLWEEEGRPSDQEKRHWATAERIFDAPRAGKQRWIGTLARRGAKGGKADWHW